LPDILRHPTVLATIGARLKSFAAQSTGSSNRVCRALLLVVGYVALFNLIALLVINAVAIAGLL